MNCGAIPKDLLESEFLGHKRGAFTGAVEERRGHFEQAKNGTLFLDELGELPLEMQVKLLRAIQEKKITRVGESIPVDISARIISATNRNLLEVVANGGFREDLYYRLGVLTLRLPPLRERQGDITLLTEKLFERLQAQLEGSIGKKKLSPGAKNLLLRHSWPGNVRELEATLLRALVWSTSGSISEAEMKSAIVERAGDGPASILDQSLGNGFDLDALKARVERHYIERALAEAHNNKTKAAALLGISSHQTLSNRMGKGGAKS